MTYAQICGVVNDIKKRYGETDPKRLCRDMGVDVLYMDLGTAQDAIKGFCVSRFRVSTIIINSDLPEIFRRIITAHELGHAVLHAGTGPHSFHDAGLFDESAMFEKDANLFAAELLLDDEDVLEALNSDVTFSGAAATLNVPVELLDFKFRLMKWKGCKLTVPSLETRSNFLKDVEVPVNYDECEC